MAKSIKQRPARGVATLVTGAVTVGIVAFLLTAFIPSVRDLALGWSAGALVLVMITALPYGTLCLRDWYWNKVVMRNKIYRKMNHDARFRRFEDHC